MFPLAGNGGATRTYIEDVFSAYTYTGNGSTQTITNGIDLAGKGGMVWIKSRADSQSHTLFDTARGNTKSIITNTTAAQVTSTSSNDLTGFTSSGFSLGPSVAAGVNSSGNNYVSWTSRKAPKFFDVVTFNYTSGAFSFSHSLGASPGMVVIKSTTNAENWWVYHRSTGTDYYLTLNQTSGQQNSPGIWTATATTFGGINGVLSAGTYVAYVFAHDTGTDGLIQCGSFTHGSDVTLGWEPQFVLVKPSTTTGDWTILDSMRGFTVDGVADARLMPNLSSAEAAAADVGQPTASGFKYTNTVAGNTYIYLAIRRGPMRLPTSGTQVYQAIARTGTGAAATVTGVGFPPDLVVPMSRAPSGYGHTFFNRLRGSGKLLVPNTTGAEATEATTLTGFNMDGVSLGIDANSLGVNTSGVTQILHFFRRYPGVFDICAYTGTGSARTVAHNLGVAPELMIVKRRSGADNWQMYVASLGASATVILNGTNAVFNGTSAWNSTAPTASVFSTGGAISSVNAVSETYVAYLFATLAGISKVGSYTGTGTTKQVDCGFAAGARFVLIKRTDSTGDWYIWDSVRGIIAGNDPYLLLNSTVAEATATDYIDPYAAGFELSSSAPAAINANGGTFVYLAFA